MVYLVAKNKNKHGSYAFKTTNGEHIKKIKRSLYSALGDKGIQIVTISRPTTFGEYSPYHFVHSEEEFMKAAKELAE